MSFVVEQQGRLLKAKYHRHSEHKINPSPAKRGKVSGFSRKSRKRMLEKLARLSIPAVVHFVTLTYSDHTVPLDGKTAKQHLRALLERVRRRWPKSSGIWRMEVEYRKSGVYSGCACPHFHLLLINCDSMPMPMPTDTWKFYTGWINVVWADIIGHYNTTAQKPPLLRTDCQLLDGSRAVMYYTAKYAAKTASPLVSQPYLHEQGRLWGSFNSSFLPYAPLTTREVWGKNGVFYNFRRAFNGHSPQYAHKRLNQGFTLFSDHAVRWLDYLHYLLIE